jgi:hypothetical protein
MKKGCPLIDLEKVFCFLSSTLGLVVFPERSKIGEHDGARLSESFSLSHGIGNEDFSNNHLTVVDEFKCIGSLVPMVVVVEIAVALDCFVSACLNFFI